MQELFEKYQLQPFVTEVYEKLQGYQGGTVSRSDLVLFLVGKGSVTYANIVKVLDEIDHVHAMKRVAALDPSFQKMYATVVDEFYDGVRECMALYENRYAGEIVQAWVVKMEAWISQYAQSLPPEHREYILDRLDSVRKSAIEMIHGNYDSDIIDFELRALRAMHL